MSFNDIAQALQFGAGLVHGFQKQTEDIRAQHDKQQFELLKLLAQDETKNVTPIDQGDVVGDQGFFGGGTLKTKEGHPAFKVGGNLFAVRPRPALGGGDNTEAAVSGVPAPTAAPQPKGLAPMNQYGPVPEVPAAPATPTLPQGGPAQETKGPGKGPNVEALKSYAARKAREMGVPPDAVLAIIQHESYFNPSATGTQGEVGLMQIHPNTMAETGFTAEQLRDPKTNIDAGIGVLKRKIAAAGGDVDKGIRLYNGSGPKAEQYGQIVQKLRGQYAQYASAQPPSAKSTPEQDAAYRAQNQQAAGQPDTSMQVAGPGAPAPKQAQAAAQPTTEQPDTSMMVAGPGAPAPKEAELPPADTLAARQQAAEAAATKRYKGAQTRTEMKEYRTAVKEARDKAETHYGQELREVEKNVKELRGRTHDPRILDMLDEVKTYNQFEHVKAIIKATPEQDFRGQAVDQLKRAIKAGKEDEVAVEVWKNMERANYSDKEIEAAMKIAGYDDIKDITKARKKAEQQKAIDIKAAPEKIAAERPEIIKTKEAEAGIIKPKDDDVPMINLEMQHDIAAGKVPSDITMDAWLKRNPEFLVSLQKKREAGVKMESPVGKLQDDRKKLVSEGKSENDAAIRAIDQQLERLGETPEETGERAAKKQQAMKAAESDRIGQAQDDANKILSGETPPPAGMTKYTAVLQRLRRDHLKPEDVSPEFANEIAEHKDFTKLEDRQRWVTSDYMLPAVESKADAKEKGAKQLTKEEAPRFSLGNELHVKLQRIDDNMKKLAEIDPRWKALSEGQGLPNRMKLAYYQSLVKIAQSGPGAAFMKAINSDMKEIEINYGRFITGMQGRPAQKLIELSTQDLPNVDTSVVGWMTGKGKIPDNPATVLTHLGLMKDMIRTVQDDVMMEHGVITAQEKTKRAEKRLDDLAHPERAKAAAATQAAPATATPTPAAPTPAAPVKPQTKGEEEADAYRRGGKP